MLNSSELLSSVYLVGYTPHNMYRERKVIFHNSKPIYTNDNAKRNIQTFDAGRLLHTQYNMQRIILLHATCIIISMQDK